MGQKNVEYLLNWLEEFYATAVNVEDLPAFVSDEQIKNDYCSFKTIPISPGVLKICNIRNPGWALEFGLKSSGHQNNNLSQWRNIDNEHDWLDWQIIGNILSTFAGPLYLSSSLEVLRCYIEGEAFNIPTYMKERLDDENGLLKWLESIFISCCQPIDEIIINHDDSDRYYVFANMSIISTSCGWVIAFDLSNIEGGENSFEEVFIEAEGGTIECYKTEENILIIRTHFRGLIIGLAIFKGWAEENFRRSSES